MNGSPERSNTNICDVWNKNIKEKIYQKQSKTWKQKYSLGGVKKSVVDFA